MGSVWATPPVPVPVPTIAPFSPAATSYWQNFQMDQATATITNRTATFTQSSMDFMGMPSPTNLAQLKAKGKPIVYHGTADPVFSSNHTRNWYESLRAADYARVPRARHEPLRRETGHRRVRRVLCTGGLGREGQCT
ncbi:MAG: hypothetical protein RLZZ373_1572 [Pseudomonadota bacterium]|jgi:feruloyl esterase